MAEAVVYALENEFTRSNLYNIGTGKDVTIKELGRNDTKSYWAPRSNILWDASTSPMVRQEN